MHTIQDQVNLVKKLSDDELVDKIEEIKTIVSPEIIPLLIDKWYKTNNETLRNKLFQFFLNSKDQDEIPLYLSAITNETYEEKRHELISILWQASLDASEYLDELIEIAISGDYMTLIEIGTVIDNLESEFDEDFITNSMYQIDEAIELELDESRILLLQNLRLIVSELHLI